MRTILSAIGMIVLTLGVIGAGHEPAVHATSTFIGSTIVDIGSDGQKVTIRTAKGESLTLAVADPESIKSVKKGDQVSLELGPDDRVHKIVKVDGGESPTPRGSDKDQ